MRVKLISSLSKQLWDAYAKFSIPTWVEHLKLDEGSEIELWILGEFPKGLPTKTASGTPIKYKMIDTQSEGWQHFYATYNKHPKPQNIPQGQEYKFNFLPFSIKVFAQAEVAWELKTQTSNDVYTPKWDYVIWLDVDVHLEKTVDTTYLQQVIGNNDLAWLDRGAPWGHGETGFIMYKTTEESLDIFFNQANVYGSGQLFYFAEWHDAFIFSTLMRMKEFTSEAFKIKNLNEDMQSQKDNGLYPFVTSVLGTHMKHLKGNLKHQQQQQSSKAQSSNTFAEAVFA
jgi:hypothetical protein